MPEKAGETRPRQREHVNGTEKVVDLPARGQGARLFSRGGRRRLHFGTCAKARTKVVPNNYKDGRRQKREGYAIHLLGHALGRTRQANAVKLNGQS